MSDNPIVGMLFALPHADWYSPKKLGLSHGVVTGVVGDYLLVRRMYGAVNTLVSVAAFAAMEPKLFDPCEERSSYEGTVAEGEVFAARFKAAGLHGRFGGT